jgi:thiol-disulfide isomerase/thioredoxin
MNTDLSDIKRRTVSASQYIESLKEPYREKFFKRKQEYRLNGEAVGQLKRFTEDYCVVAFSAEWCKDCATNIPVLALVHEKAGLEVRIFGNIKKDPLSKTRKWRIPPSPPEVETFKIDKLPTILIFNKQGKEIGEIIENPTNLPTLEQELEAIIKSSLSP